MKTYKTKEELKNYFGRTLFEVKTSFKNGKISQKVKEVYVEDLFDFNLRKKPAENCDMIIDNYSTNSDYIYGLKKGIFMDLGKFSLHRYNEINLSTFCEKNEIEKVIDLHINSIKKSIEDLKEDLRKEIETLTFS